MSIRIEAIATRVVEHPLRQDRVIVSPLGKQDRSRFLVVRVEGSSGLRGFGEAATTPVWSGETAEGARLAIESVLAPLLVGRAFEHPREALAVMDRVMFGNPFAKAAIDVALWDLWARQQDVPAVRLF